MKKDKQTIKAIKDDFLVRREAARSNHKLFFYVYFPHYAEYEIAPFQDEIFRITEDQDNRLAVIVAFRGSGKSTLVTFSYAIWSVLGIQQKKFVLLLSQTRTQAKQHMTNLKRELEGNRMLRNDLGPFQEEKDEWGSSSLVFTELGARIMAASSEQSIRGIRHNQHRPDLIILDDIEDMASVKTYESRQKTYNWLCGEVIPTGSQKTRVIVVGNLLHEDSMVMRLKRDIEEGQRDGEFLLFPLLDEQGVCTWPGKYPDQEAITREKKNSGSEYAWQREYLLNIVPDEDQVVHPNWIQYYDEIPTNRGSYRGVYTGIDLAISQKSTADYTAIVSALICGHEESFGVYILPNIINRRMNFPQTIEQIADIYNANKDIYSPYILVEEVGYQKAVVDQLNDQHDFWAEGVKVSSDKRSRLVTVSDMIKRGKVKFPKHGAEALIRQIVGFGVERHDDLVDAFTLIMHQAIELDVRSPRIFFV
jgi:predicted phage terminase large subunit-like protein